MTPPRQSIDWTLPDDEPVSLIAAMEPRRGEDAECLVAVPEIAIGGEQPIAGEEPSGVPSCREVIAAGETGSNVTSKRLSRHAAVALIVVSCGLAFAHGWGIGARSASEPQAHFCDGRHCRSSDTRQEWKEEPYE